MSTTSAVTTRTNDWRKPRRVMVDSGYLVAADLTNSPTYPILEAAREGRALQALSDAVTEEDVCAFTQNWGFLHHRFEGGRDDRFPLALFRVHQQYFLALARLCETVRTRPDDRQEITAALRALKPAKSEHEAQINPRPPNRILEDLLTEGERTLADQGVPTWELLKARGEGHGTIDLPEYAARTIASELSAGLEWRLRPARRTTRKGREGWEFEEIPIVDSLHQVLLWTVRSRYRVLHHYFCKGCGREAISCRAGTRFCSERCGTRARIAQWRAGKAAERKAATRKAQRRSARSANRRARSGSRGDVGRSR